MSDATSTMEHILAAIQRNNKTTTRAYKPTYHGGGNAAPGTVNPVTSKGSTKDGGKSAPKDGGGHHGVFGTIQNLANDVEQTVTGIPDGVVAIAHDPGGVGKAILQDYKRRYSPLVHGDFGKFASEIQQHPLAPLLDLSSVVTGGGTIAAKVGQSGMVFKAVEAARASKAAEIAKAADEAAAPVRKRVEALQAAVDKTTVDSASAARRAAGKAHPSRAARAVAPFKARVAKLDNAIDAEWKGIAAAKDAMANAKTHPLKAVTAKDKIATHTANINKMAQKRAGILSDMGKAEKAAKKLPADLQEAGAKAHAIHEATIATLQRQIVEESRTLTRMGRQAYKATRVATKDGVRSSRMDEGLGTTIQHLIKLQKITTSRTHLFAVEKGATATIRLALHGNPVKRLRQRLGLAVQEATIGGHHLIYPNVPLIGLRSRAIKAANNQRIIDAANIRHTQGRVLAAASALEKVGGKDTAKTDAMATAANGIIDGVAPKEYAQMVRNTRSTGESIQHSIGKGISQEEHHALTDELVKHHTTQQANDLYEATRQYFQREAIQHGGVLHPSTVAKIATNAHKLIDSPEVKAIADLQRAHAAAATHSMEQLVKLGKITRDVAGQQAVLHVKLAREALGHKPMSVAETNAMFEKAGLPTPSYNPDTLTFGEAVKSGGAFKESTGTLYQEGRRQHDPRTIVLRHEVASRATDAYNIHKLMMSASVKIPEGRDIPKNMVWVKDAVPGAEDLQKALFAGESTAAKNIEKDIPMTGEFYTKLAKEKRPAHGMAISKQAAADLAMGRHVMTAARQESLHKAITVWKYLVLTRPAFLLHNIVGNQLMYHLKTGWHGVAAYRNSKQALKSGVFAEHHAAEGITFGGSEKMGAGKSRKAKAASRTLNMFYELVGAHEHHLRELTFYDTARRMPEVKRQMARLKGGKLDTSQQTLFHQAYNAAVKENPTLRDLMTRQMDDTLGNYRYYNHAERNLKMLSPFYGWERHSVRNMIRMVEDNPATMAMLTQIGMVGHAKYNKDFGPGMPAFVHNYVQDSSIQWLAQSLGFDKRVNMMDFGPINPWGTAVDVGKAISDPKHEALKLAGPIVTAPIEEFTGKSLLTGAPVEKTKIPDKGALAPLALIERVVRGTPLPRLGEELAGTARPHKMLPTTKGLKTANNFGIDLKILDKPVAKQTAARANAPKDKYGNTIFKRRKKKAPNYN